MLLIPSTAAGLRARMVLPLPDSPGSLRRLRAALQNLPTYAEDNVVPPPYPCGNAATGLDKPEGEDWIKIEVPRAFDGNVIRRAPDVNSASAASSDQVPPSPELTYGSATL